MEQAVGLLAPAVLSSVICLLVAVFVGVHYAEALRDVVIIHFRARIHLVCFGQLLEARQELVASTRLLIWIPNTGRGAGHRLPLETGSSVFQSSMTSVI